MRSRFEKFAVVFITNDIFLFEHVYQKYLVRQYPCTARKFISLGKFSFFFKNFFIQLIALFANFR